MAARPGPVRDALGAALAPGPLPAPPSRGHAAADPAALRRVSTVIVGAYVAAVVALLVVALTQM